MFKVDNNDSRAIVLFWFVVDRVPLHRFPANIYTA